jgi:hypothetical protein
MLAVNFLITGTTEDFRPEELYFGDTPLLATGVNAIRDALESEEVLTVTNLPPACFGDIPNTRNILSAVDFKYQNLPRWAILLRLFREFSDIFCEENTSRDVLMLNGMNPLLSKEVIRKAISEYRSSQKDVLASAKHLMDNHPALNWVYYAKHKEGRRLEYSGGMDGWERFSAPGFWKVDRNTQTILCSRTGKLLTGRQQLPNVYELDGNLLLFKKEHLSRLDALLLTPATLIFPLCETVSEGTVYDRFTYFKAALFYRNTPSAQNDGMNRVCENRGSF